MMKQLEVASYRRVNESYRRRMVCHVGIDSGFFVEFQYMVNAMLYCLAHRVRFQIYADDANYGTGIGWTEYFLPFCDEVHDSFHHKYNFHWPPSWHQVLNLCVSQKSLGPVVWKLKSILKNWAGHLLSFRAYRQCVLLSQDVPPVAQRHYCVPELGLDCDYMEAFALVSRMVWRLQPEVLRQEMACKSELSLPPIYSGVQIRGGDKITETRLVDGKAIIQELNPNDGDCVFILTDDYSQYLKAKADFPQLRLLTLCRSGEQGYDLKQFSQVDPQSKKEAIIRLIVSVDLLLKSRSFVGSIITGPSVFVMRLRYDDPLVQAVDCPKDELPSALPLPVYARSIISAKYIQDGKKVVVK